MSDHTESGSELARLIEGKVVPLLERIALALERSPGLAAAEHVGPEVSEATVDDLRQRIEAARTVNDPDGAMSLRDELAGLISGEPLREVDQGLVKWLMALIQRRLRGGMIRPDVVELATKVGERFGATVEGASLKAALPTLRRSAGLCPRCAEPYTGVLDACPKCLAAAAPRADDLAPEAGPAGDPDADLDLQAGPVDLNNVDL